MHLRRDSYISVYHLLFLLGVIRGIDIEKQIFYVTTPLSPDQLKSVVVIASGSLELPLAAMMLEHIAFEVPYMTYLPAEGIASMTRSTRSNLIRKKHAPE